MKKILLWGMLVHFQFLLAQPEDIHVDIFNYDTVAMDFESQRMAFEDKHFNADSQLILFVSMWGDYGSKTQNHYANNEISSSINWQYNAQILDWDLPTRRSFFKDGKGRDTLMWEEKMDQNQQWNPNFGNRYRITEDQQGRVTLVEEETFIWNSWHASGSREYFYLDADSLPDEIRYLHENNGIKTYYRRWRCVDWGGVFSYRLYPYPAVYYSDNWSNGNWVNQLYDSNLYYADSTIQYRYLPNSQGSGYYLDFVRHNHLDEFGNFILYFDIKRDSAGWDTTSMTSYFIHYLSPGKVDHVIRSKYSYSQLIEKRKYVYSYSPINSVYAGRETRLKLFPNPVASNGSLFLSEGNWTKAIIYSLNGKEISSLEVGENGAIQLPHLKQGIYLLHCTDQDGKSYRQKIEID